MTDSLNRTLSEFANTVRETGEVPSGGGTPIKATGLLASRPTLPAAGWEAGDGYVEIVDPKNSNLHVVNAAADDWLEAVPYGTQGDPGAVVVAADMVVKNRRLRMATVRGRTLTLSGSAYTVEGVRSVSVVDDYAPPTEAQFEAEIEAGLRGDAAPCMAPNFDQWVQVPGIGTLATTTETVAGLPATIIDSINEGSGRVLVATIDDPRVLQELRDGRVLEVAVVARFNPVNGDFTAPGSQSLRLQIIAQANDGEGGIVGHGRAGFRITPGGTGASFDLASTYEEIFCTLAYDQLDATTDTCRGVALFSLSGANIAQINELLLYAGTNANDPDLVCAMSRPSIRVVDDYTVAVLDTIPAPGVSIAASGAGMPSGLKALIAKPSSASGTVIEMVIADATVAVTYAHATDELTLSYTGETSVTVSAAAWPTDFRVDVELFVGPDDAGSPAAQLWVGGGAAPLASIPLAELPTGAWDGAVGDRVAGGDWLPLTITEVHKIVTPGLRREDRVIEDGASTATIPVRGWIYARSS